jgi:hypothetical protein
VTSKLPALTDLYVEKLPGRCIMCDEPVVQRMRVREQVCCESKECRREFRRIYNRNYKRFQRMGLNMKNFSSTREPVGRLLW